MKFDPFSLVTRSVGVALMLGTSSLAYAQDVEEQETASQEPALELNTIVVTARRVEESLQEVPISATAFDEDFIDNAQLQDIGELRNFTPNLSFSTTAPVGGSTAAASVFIRGVGQTDFIITTEPGVGIYLDGAYIARSTGGVLSALDVERVEVLRGPQGTLFGRNTIGGAINVTSKKPDFVDVSGSVELIVGQRDRYSLRSGLNVPLSDTLAIRGAFDYTKQDGYGARPLAGDRTGETDEFSGRVALRWQPTDRIDFNLAVDGTKTRETGGVISVTGIESPEPPLLNLFNALVAGPAGTPYNESILSDDPRVSFGTGPNLNEIDIFGIQLNAEFDLGGATLNSITAYRDLDTTFGRDADGSPLDYASSLQRIQQDQFSQELQLYGDAAGGRLNWQVGAYYFEEMATDQNDLNLLIGVYDALEALPAAVIPLAPVACPAPFPAPCAGGPGNPLNVVFDLDLDVFNQIENKSYAAFGQATFDLTETLSVTGGIRYTRDEKDFFLQHLRERSGIFIVPPTAISETFNDTSLKAGIEYEPEAGKLIYLSYSEGFKSGGFNARPTAEAELSSFEPERVKVYEAGFKLDLLDRRVRLNGAAFFNDYTDIQVTFAFADPVTGNILFNTANAAEAEIKGFELEATVLASEWLTLFGSVGHTDAEYTQTEPGALVNGDTRFPRTPKWTLTTGAEVTVPVGNSGNELFGRLDYSYRSTVELDALNCPFVTQPSVSLLNGAAAFRFLGGLEFGVYGKNLTNEEYFDAGTCFLGSFGVGEAYLAPPRELGLSIKFSF